MVQLVTGASEFGLVVEGLSVVAVEGMYQLCLELWTLVGLMEGMSGDQAGDHKW